MSTAIVPAATPAAAAPATPVPVPPATRHRFILERAYRVTGFLSLAVPALILSFWFAPMGRDARRPPSVSPPPGTSLAGT